MQQKTYLHFLKQPFALVYVITGHALKS